MSARLKDIFSEHTSLQINLPMQVKMVVDVGNLPGTQRLCCNFLQPGQATGWLCKDLVMVFLQLTLKAQRPAVRAIVAVDLRLLTRSPGNHLRTGGDGNWVFRSYSCHPNPPFAFVLS